MMKNFIKRAVVVMAFVFAGTAVAANISTLSSTTSGSTLILLIKNATKGNYFYEELFPTVSGLRAISDLQSDMPQKYSVVGDNVTGPLNESTLQTLNSYTSANLQAYLSGNAADAITWTIMGSKSGPNANNGQAALVVTSNNDFLVTTPWFSGDAWQAAGLFNTFLIDEINNSLFTIGVSSTNGWGSANPSGSGAPISFNGAGYENGAALGVAQYVYLLSSTGSDAANVYKSIGKLNLSSTGVLSYSNTSSYTVGGNVSGLGAGKTLVLNNNGGDAKTISASGTFTFATSIASGGAYVVTVATQPAGQTCLVSNGSGSVTANVTTVSVTCTTNTYTVGGSVTGLGAGKTLVLNNNGGDAKTINASGAFTFTTSIASGGAYAVTVATQPTGQTCLISNGSGSVTANVTNVSVSCTTGTYTVGGSVTGLGTGKTLVLNNNGGDAKTLSANGVFTFATAIASGNTYAVTVATQPTGQVCTLSNATGTVSSLNVDTVSVNCSVNTYTIAVTNSSGAAVAISGSLATNTSPNSNASFNFSAIYGDSVTLAATKTGNTCTVTPSSISGISANTSATVSCTPTTHTVSGTVTGNTGTVTLTNNNGDSKTVASGGGSFTFTAQNYGTAYLVATTSPTGQTCLVSNDSGTVTSNVTTVSVVCTTNTYTVGGLVSGLSGSVTLMNNGADPIVLSINRSFTFTSQVASGSNYNVTIGTQPAGQTCSVTNPTGTIAGANVTNVVVSCSFTDQGGHGGGGSMDKSWLFLLVALALIKMGLGRNAVMTR